jgi:predicted glycosyltransferase
MGWKLMRILLDLVHPADALFFYHAILSLKEKGVDVRVVSRRKDVLINLLDELGVEHLPITTARRGTLGLARELVERDVALVRIASAWKPDVMAGFGGVAISHVGKLLGIRSVSFYDTEHASLQMRLTLPFISEWHVPRSWKGPVAAGRTFHFAGSKQFAYLHPAYFRPDPDRARAAGWDPGRANFVLRAVAWQANHDRGRRGMSVAQLRRISAYLSSLGKLHISAEGQLPADLQALQYSGRNCDFHHLLAHCRLYCGESITVASEAVALGIPVLLQIDKEYAYVKEQEEAGLIRRLGSVEDSVAVLQAMLGERHDEFRRRARQFVASSIDINQYIVNALLHHDAGSRSGPGPGFE